MSVTITCPKIGHRVFLRPFFETQQCVTPDTPSSRDAAPSKNYCNDFNLAACCSSVLYNIILVVSSCDGNTVPHTSNKHCYDG